MIVRSRTTQKFAFDCETTAPRSRRQEIKVIKGKNTAEQKFLVKRQGTSLKQIPVKVFRQVGQSNGSEERMKGLEKKPWKQRKCVGEL